MKFSVFLLILGCAAIMVACQPLGCELNFVKVDEKDSKMMDPKDEQDRIKRNIASCKDRSHSHSSSLSTALRRYTFGRSLVKTVASPLSYLPHGRVSKAKLKNLTKHKSTKKQPKRWT